jgi:predicted nuclease with TOPRIM domain
VSGNVKWGCCQHISDKNACRSNYYSEERIYDGFIAMVNKLRFGEDILGQVISRLESATIMYKKNNLAAREMSQNIAELNAKLLMLEQLRAKGYLAPEVHQAQSREISNQLASLKKERQTELDTQIIRMLEDVRHLKATLDELEDPLESFDEKLFVEIIKKITISRADEMEMTIIGGLKFTELI